MLLMQTSKVVQRTALDVKLCRHGFLSGKRRSIFPLFSSSVASPLCDLFSLSSMTSSDNVTLVSDDDEDEEDRENEGKEREAFDKDDEEEETTTT